MSNVVEVLVKGKNEFGPSFAAAKRDLAGLESSAGSG
jgi:hypothetical protein